MAKIIKLPSAFVIDTKTAGVSKENEDGTSRQYIIRNHVAEGDKLKLKREPDNQYDPNAIQVLTESELMIGYLPRNIASRLMPV